MANTPTIYLWCVVYNLEPCDGLCYSLHPARVEFQNLRLMKYELWVLNGSIKKTKDTEAGNKHTVRTAVLQHSLLFWSIGSMLQWYEGETAWCLWLCCGPYGSTVKKSIMVSIKFLWMFYDLTFLFLLWLSVTSPSAYASHMCPHTHIPMQLHVVSHLPVKVLNFTVCDCANLDRLTVGDWLTYQWYPPTAHF